MRRVLMATVLFVLVSGVAWAAPTNEEQIRKRFDDFAAAWNKHDPTELAYFWSADGDLINPMGRKAKGLTEIQRLFQDEQTTLFKQSTFHAGPQSIRYLEPGLAVVDADVDIQNVLNPDGSTANMKVHVANLMKKSGGQWWIVSARAYNFLTPPPAPPK